MRSWHAVAVPLVVATLLTGAAPELERVVRDVLARDLKFSANDLAELERGKIVKHSLDSKVAGEIAVVGAARVIARKEAFVARVRDIVQFKRGADVLQIGRFSNPPTIEDLEPLTVAREDLDVRACRVGDCDIRLPADIIGRFQREIDWHATDAQARAAALFKQVLLEHVRAYLWGGQGRITEYDDGRHPIRPADEFNGLLKNSPYIGELVPGLPARLQSLSSASVAGAEDFLYWSKEKFGITPFITVTHVTIAPGVPGTDTITSKDVYSSRYLDASLAFTIASEAVGTSGGAFYLVYVNRSRANALKGSFAGLRRSIVERRARNALEENLKAARARLEHP